METSRYEPSTDAVHLAPGASLYCRFHEEAHREQCKTRRWRFVANLRDFRLVNYLATLWIEYDALRRARAVMEKLGVWTEDAEQEARRSFYSYVRRNEVTN